MPAGRRTPITQEEICRVLEYSRPSQGGPGLKCRRDVVTQTQVEETCARVHESGAAVSFRAVYSQTGGNHMNVYRWWRTWTNRLEAAAQLRLAFCRLPQHVPPSLTGLAHYLGELFDGDGLSVRLCVMLFELLQDSSATERATLLDHLRFFLTEWDLIVEDSQDALGEVLPLEAPPAPPDPVSLPPGPAVPSAEELRPWTPDELAYVNREKGKQRAVVLADTLQRPLREVLAQVLHLSVEERMVSSL